MNQIKSTTDYSIFKKMEGNRRLDMNHVERIRKEMEANPDWFAGKPIDVNEHLFVADGQHRLEAAKLANRPVYYVVVPGITLAAARSMNINQKIWTNRDYAQSYADSGKVDYINLLRTATQYPRLSLGILVNVLSEEFGYDTTAKFRNGEFKIPDYDESIESVKVLSEIAKVTSRRLTRPPVAAIMMLHRNNDEFDIEKFLRKVSDKPDMFTPGQTNRDNLRMIEDLYNRNVPEVNRVRFY